MSHRSPMTSIYLSPRGANSLAGDHANDSGSVMNYRCLLRASISSSDRWISRLHRPPRNQREAVARNILEPMPENLSKQPENAPGPWYVDTSCALCRMCLEEAPNLITYNRDETGVHFFKEPETPEEIDAAQRAMEVCPTLAIGNDG